MSLQALSRASSNTGGRVISGSKGPGSIASAAASAAGSRAGSRPSTSGRSHSLHKVSSMDDVPLKLGMCQEGKKLGWSCNIYRKSTLTACDVSLPLQATIASQPGSIQPTALRATKVFCPANMLLTDMDSCPPQPMQAADLEGGSVASGFATPKSAFYPQTPNFSEASASESEVGGIRLCL